MKKIGKIFKIPAIVLLALVAAVVLLLCGLTLYLTPNNLTNLANRELSSYFNADVTAKNINYTLWSSFPRFNITADSVVVISRTLKDQPAAIRRQLPAYADSLGSLRRFSGGINVIDLFLNRFVIHDVKIDGLNLNLVAYNDSINNYNILPSEDSPMKRVPYFTIKSASLNNPGSIRYFSAATNTLAELDLAKLDLKRLAPRHKNNYTLSFNGKMNLRSSGLQILKGFPFDLSGDIHLRFNPFGVDLSNYGINIGGIHSELTMSMGMGENPRINNLTYHISSLSLMNLLESLPKEYIPNMQGIRADIDISARAKFNSPWNFSSETLPEIEVDFDIPAGDITYYMTDSRSYPLSYSPISGKLLFDGKDPARSYFAIPEFHIYADGIDAGIEALIADITSSPKIKGSVALTADLAPAKKYFAPQADVKVSGNLDLRSDIFFSIPSFSKSGIEDGLSNLRADADVDISHADIYIDGNLIAAENLKVDLSGAYRGVLSPAVIKQGIPLDVKIQSGALAYTDTAKGMNVAIANFRVRDFKPNAGISSLQSNLKKGLTIRADSIIIASLSNGGGKSTRNGATLRYPTIQFSLEQNADEIGKNALRIVDFRNEKGVDSPLDVNPLLEVAAPQVLREFLAKYDFNLHFMTKEILPLPGGSLRDAWLGNIDISADNDSFHLINANADIEDVRGRISGEIGNIRNFLLLPASESNPLMADFNVALDTVNLNNLSKAYVDSKGGIEKIPKHPVTTADDSLPLLVPRNLQVKLTASAREAVYWKLRLFNLMADVNMERGIFAVPQLDIGAPFGRGALAFRYDSHDIEHLKMGLNVEVTNVDIVNFFKSFKSLLAMAPQMKNLTGYVSIGARGETDIFPDMYVNVPSADCDLSFSGRDLKLHQSKFIRKITRMMLIRNDDDIHIKDIDIHGSMHDNLLQVDPFDFQFDRYKLNLVGVNNFNGDLYYHIGVLESPIPFPFGINVEGEYSHPELRFGGASYNLRHSEEITSEIQESNNFNLMTILHQLLRAFLKTGSANAN